MERPNLVRDRFLADLAEWLTPSLLFHCFTGEDDPYRLAHIEDMQPALQEPLLNKAERDWPQRLQHIAALRQEQKQQSKAVVRTFVQASLVGADAEPHHRGCCPTARYGGPARSGLTARLAAVVPVTERAPVTASEAW
jgi:hypothetical protein